MQERAQLELSRKKCAQRAQSFVRILILFFIFLFSFLIQIFLSFLFILGPILPGVSLPTWPKSWTTFTGQTAQVTSFILLFITPEYLKWWATAYPLFLLLLPSAYCLPFGNSIFFNLYYLIHTTYSRDYMGRKCEGNCGLWVFNEMIKKKYP